MLPLFEPLLSFSFVTQEELAAEEELQQQEAAAAAAQAAAAARSPLRRLAEWGWQLLQRLCLALLAAILAASKAVQGGLARLEADFADPDAADEAADAACAAPVGAAVSAGLLDEGGEDEDDDCYGRDADGVFAGASATTQ